MDRKEVIKNRSMENRKDGRKQVVTGRTQRAVEREWKDKREMRCKAFTGKTSIIDRRDLPEVKRQKGTA